MKPVWVLLAAMLLVALVVYIAQLEAQSEQPHHVPLPQGSMLAVSFAHADHVEQPCIECHHNYADDTGQGMCFDCHKTHAEVAHLIEAQFHDMCRGCHIDNQLAGDAHGPTRHCVDCHIPDSRP